MGYLYSFKPGPHKMLINSKEKKSNFRVKNLKKHLINQVIKVNIINN